MYSDAVIRNALNVERAGSAGPGAVGGEAGNPSCGDTVRIELRLGNGRITAARHATFGCPHATAAAAVLCRLVEDMTILEAAAVGLPQLETELGVDLRRRACLDVAVDALAAALCAGLAAAPVAPDAVRVAVAMSGGVDSAAALLKVREAGFEPVGVTLRLWIDPAAPRSERACCSPDSVRAARAACHRLGAAHLGLDLRDDFRAAVVDGFVADYAAGRTPNPCVRCNSSFRFDALADFADLAGAPRIATGHYAQVDRSGDRAVLRRGADSTKDQSYMLAGVPQPILERCWFPLGGQTKTQTRAEARAAGLEAAGRAESQEVCFVGGGDHRAFLERFGGAGPEGEIVAEDGRVLAHHGGIHRFTPGQRRGVGVSAGEPLYVIRTEPRSGRVVVGPRGAGDRRTVRVSPGRMDVADGRVQAKLRYRSEPVWATARACADGFELELETAVAGIAAGQTAVLYHGDAVVGAGTIS